MSLRREPIASCVTQKRDCRVQARGLGAFGSLQLRYQRMHRVARQASCRPRDGCVDGAGHRARHHRWRHLPELIGLHPVARRSVKEASRRRGEGQLCAPTGRPRRRCLRGRQKHTRIAAGGRDGHWVGVEAG